MGSCLLFKAPIQASPELPSTPPVWCHLNILLVLLLPEHVISGAVPKHAPCAGVTETRLHSSPTGRSPAGSACVSAMLFLSSDTAWEPPEAMPISPSLYLTRPLHLSLKQVTHLIDACEDSLNMSLEVAVTQLRCRKHTAVFSLAELQRKPFPGETGGTLFQLSQCFLLGGGGGGISYTVPAPP